MTGHGVGCVSRRMEGDEFSAGEEEGDFEEGGEDEEMVEFIANGEFCDVCDSVSGVMVCRGRPASAIRGEDFHTVHDKV